MGATEMMQALNRVAKWRVLLTGWQLGTRLDTDPEAQAVKDHRELSMIERIELTALTKVLVDKGLVTTDEFVAAVTEEADLLNDDYARRFPGIRATEHGLVFGPEAAQTMAGWRK